MTVDAKSSKASTTQTTTGDDSDANYSKLKTRRDNVIFFVVIATVFAIPLIVYTTTRRIATIGDVPTSGLVLWFFVGWCTLCLLAVLLWAIKMLWKMIFDVLEDPLKAPMSALVGDVENATLSFLALCVLYGIW